MAPHQTQDTSSIVTRDPVCGMQVAPDSPLRFEYSGKIWLFCCQRCLARFADNPEAFIAEKRGDLPKQEGSAFFCPMHPEVRASESGPCPHCGMLLEPEGPSSEQEDAEQRRLTRRLVLAITLTVPLVALAMADHLFGLSYKHSSILQAILATPVVFWAGLPFFERGLKNLRSPNMFTLIILGVTASYLYSLAAILVPQFYLDAARYFRADHIYFESAAVIITLVLVGQLLEGKARDRTKHSLRALLSLTPTKALLVKSDGTEIEVPASMLKVGDVVRLKTGATVPVDGRIVEGVCVVDESSVTGEPFPVRKEKSAHVTCGTVVVDGTALAEAERVGSDTLVSLVAQEAAKAMRSRAPVQAIADRVAARFVPAVLLIALSVFVLWVLLEGSAGKAIVASVSVLVIACPCALGVATPAAITVAIGKAARSGVLFREAKAIQALASANAVVLDKTGTLTLGKPKVLKVITFDGFCEEEVVGLAASLERNLTHPFAQAIVDYARLRRIGLGPVVGFSSKPGLGVEGQINGRRVLVGSLAYAKMAGVDLQEANEYLAGESLSIAILAVDKRLAGLFLLEDPIRPEAKKVVEALHEGGMRTFIVSGDSSPAVEHVARKVGVEKIFAGMSPLDKTYIVQRLRRQGLRVVVVGDGINDAGALAASDVGVALSSGADLAKQIAPVVLIHRDLRALVWAWRFAQRTVKTIKQNLFFAFLYNFLAIPVAAGLFYPFLGLILNPSIAALAMSMSSLLVLANSLRLGKTQPLPQ